MGFPRGLEAAGANSGEMWSHHAGTSWPKHPTRADTICVPFFFSEQLPGFSFLLCPSIRSPQTSGISITWKLVETQALGPLRPAEPAAVCY